MTLLPGAESDMDQFQLIFLVNNLTITVYDRVNLQSDPFGYAALDNLSEFVRFQNTAGLELVYDLTDVKLYGDYEHGWIRIISPDSLEHLDRSFDALAGSVTGDITHWFNMGFQASYVNTRFKRPWLRSNSHTFSFGPNFDLKPTDNIQILATIQRTASTFKDTGITGRGLTGLTPHGTGGVLTDIADSTALWESDSATMNVAQRVHDEVLRSLLPTHHGYEVSTEGDAFFVVFHCAADAVAEFVELGLEIPGFLACNGR